MDAKACIDILQNRPPLDLQKLAAEQPYQSTQQVLDLETGNVQRVPIENGTETEGNISAEDRHKNEVKKKTIDLSSDNESQLIQFCRKTQQERAVVFNEFNGALKDMLKVGSFVEYPVLCSRVTSQFASLSSDMCAAIQLLSNLGSSTAKPLSKIQEMESEKLTLTAALHLEKIRKLQCEASSIESTREKDTSLKIFNDNCVTFQQRLDTVIGGINEALEEVIIEHSDSIED
jgi:hypothetical protein